MCHCPHHLDVSFPQDPPHSQFLFFLPFYHFLKKRKSRPPFEDLGHTFLFSMFISLSWPTPFSVCYFILINLRIAPPLGKASAWFWVLPRYQKTVDSPEHRRGDGRETNRVYVLFTLGRFSPIPHHLFTCCTYIIKFCRVLSRVSWSKWGILVVVAWLGGWRNLLYGTNGKNDCGRWEGLARAT